MDTSADVLYGPNPVQKTGTVTIPRELLKEVGLTSGDRVHWALNPAIPGTLVLIPSVQLARTMPAILEAVAAHGR